MWRQRFPVKDENRIDARKEIDEWMISLAFPFGVRLKRGHISAGIYAFLPTEMVTNFPFIIQADFLLTSSREAIRLDNKWNKGILDCVSSAFVNALASLAKSVGTAPVSSIVNMFEFLPVQKSPSPELEVVREAIKAKIQSKTIMPCDTFSEQLVFCRPYEAARILPDFREILFKLKKQGALINWISFQGQYILHSDVDLKRFEEVFHFLEIQFVNYSWYARCIQECDLVLEANNDIYLELLHFLSDNWCKGFAGTAMEDIPLLKYVDQHGIILLCSISAAAMGSTRNLSFAWDPKQHSWINKWNMEFRCMKNLYMLPNSTAASLSGFTRSYSLYTWLKLYAGIKATDVRDFASFMLNCVSSSRDRNLVLSFTHFIYHSLSKKYITTDDVIKISHHIPVINKYSTVTAVRTSILAPASGSKWEKLIGANCFFGENYVELGGDYLLPCYFAGEYTSENELKGFIDDYLKPLDLPSLQPPDVELPVASSLLSKERALVLLDWIDNLRNMSTLKDNRFLRSVKEGKWLKTCSGCSSPNCSFISGKEAENIFSDLGAVSFDSYIIDERFYDCKIGAYKKVLKLVGVKHGLKGTCEIIAEHFASICSSQLNKNEVLYLLSFIRFSKLNRHLTKGFIDNIKNGQWLKSTQGYRTPLGSVYLSSGEQENLSQVANLPFIDELFYGNEIGGYVSELKLLGVVVDLDDVSSLTASNIAHRLTSIDSNSQLSKEEVISTLGFIRYLKVNKELTDDFLNRLKLGKWLKTNQGYRRPLRTVYLPHETDALSQVDNLPIVDDLFYGDDIGGYKEELKMLGVLVSVNEVYALVANHIPLPPYPSCLTRNNGILIMKCVRNVRFDDVFLYKIRSKPWLKTKLGYKCPTESILSDPNWDCISHIVEAPFIDESFYGSGIRSFKDEFRRVGVAVEYIDACKIVAAAFKKIAAFSGLRNTHVLSLLESLRQLKGTPFSPEMQFKSILLDSKWILTCRGYRTACTSILFDENWHLVSGIANLPFIDHDYYGSSIFSFKDELKAMGVTVDYNDGFQFVITCLKLPKCADRITASSVLALLKCIRSMQSSGQSLPERFLKKIRTVKWLKTQSGYQYPHESFLYDFNWASLLEVGDAPFISEEFYGSNILSYKDELKALGVITYVGEGCSVIAGTLLSHTELSIIKRLYNYLRIFKWAPEEKYFSSIWIPNLSGSDGKWVGEDDCLLSDPNDLFGSHLGILDRYYDSTLLPFFSSAFGVRHEACIDDYLRVWREWENVAECKVSFSKCCAFWKFITEKWNSEGGNRFVLSIRKLPSQSASGTEIQLVNKQDVYIPDDLQLKTMLERSFPEKPLFIWHPDPTLYSIPLCKLYAIYSTIGVKNLSQSVQKCADSFRLYTHLPRVTSKDSPIRKGLIKLILAFLANPGHGISAERRHNIARELIDLTVLETDNPMTISYSLRLPLQGKTLIARAVDMVRWEKDSQTLIITKTHGKKPRLMIEFATRFAEVVSSGVLWDSSDLINDLCKLIHVGCILGFDTEVVDFLLVKENLQLFHDDKEFLSAAFSSKRD